MLTRELVHRSSGEKPVWTENDEDHGRAGTSKYETGDGPAPREPCVAEPEPANAGGRPLQDLDPEQAPDSEKSAQDHASKHAHRRAVVIQGTIW
jgi:hypothetical protein